MQIGLTLWLNVSLTLKVKLQGSITVRAYYDLYYSVDYGSSVPKKYCHIMWFDTAIAAIGFLLALFIAYAAAKKRGITR